MVDEVRHALASFREEFLGTPTLFFTEHDVASRLYHLVQEELGYTQVKAADGTLHYLVHHEYPTPFRCDMNGSTFSVMDEDTRTPKGGKFRRGHYDLVVFNPDFISRTNLGVVRGQDYAVLRHDLPDTMASLGQAPISIGIELVFNRIPFRSEHQIERWCRFVLQDHAKLAASGKWMGRNFMKDMVVVAINACSSPDSDSLIREILGRHETITYWSSSA